MADITPTPPVRLSIVTMGPDLHPQCTDAFTCICPACMKERAARVRNGGRDVRQPWQARPAKRAA